MINSKEAATSLGKVQPIFTDEATRSGFTVSSPQPFSSFTATFEITTNGTQRIFTESKYHNQSDVVFITSAQPSVLTVIQEGVLWRDFFDTLPFSLNEECLVTGTGQTFCSNETQTLRFFINDQETPNALNEIIRPGDNLRVVFGNQ